MENEFTVNEMMAMQRSMLEKYKEWWEDLTPESGKHHLLWMLGEAGEVIDVIKKEPNEILMEKGPVREHLIEELVDVMMFYNDVLLCYGITSEEFKDVYVRKYKRNLSRW